MSARPYGYETWSRDAQNAYYNELSHGTVPRGCPMGQHTSGPEYVPAYRREMKTLDAAQLLSMTFPLRNFDHVAMAARKGSDHDLRSSGVLARLG